MEENAESFVGDIPGFYDRALGPILFSGFAAEMASRVVADRPKRVLETAAGTGIVSLALRQGLPADVALTATDLNDAMLELARGKFGSAKDIVLERGDAMDLPYETGSFDCVVCQFGVMFYPDQVTSLREVHRVLRPGGRYRFSVWDSHRYNAFARIADEVVRATFPTDSPPFYRVPFGSSQIDPIKAMLIEAGFDQLVVEVLAREEVVHSWESFAQGLVFGNPLVDQIRVRAGDPDAVVQVLLAALQAEFGPSPATLRLQTIFYSATSA